MKKFQKLLVYPEVRALALMILVLLAILSLIFLRKFITTVEVFHWAALGGFVSSFMAVPYLTGAIVNRSWNYWGESYVYHLKNWGLIYALVLVIASVLKIGLLLI